MQLIDRPRYRVTIICDDGSRATEIVYAESPDHAKKKAIDRLPEGIHATGAIAEEEKQ